MRSTRLRAPWRSVIGRRRGHNLGRLGTDAGRPYTADNEGMAAGEDTSSFEYAPRKGACGRFDWPGPAELDERLLEEIGRAERHGTQLSCLLVVVDNLERDGR